MRLPAVSLRVPMPRLLPLTMLAMAALLAVKSAALVRAAGPATASETQAADKLPATAPEAKPGDAKRQDVKTQDLTSGNAETGDIKPGPPNPAEGMAADDKTAAATPPAEPPISESERALLLDLRQRRDELDRREAALAARESLLAATDARLTARLAELGGLQKRLEVLETERKAHDEANWQGLVKLYESMKPKDAAVIFNDLDLPVLLPVLDRMKDRKAAPVLAAMTPERARLVTEELAKLRAHANTVPPPAAGAAGADNASPGKAAGGG
jgi:flagellar motility protein MotE (MotC chaperone)